MIRVMKKINFLRCILIIFLLASITSIVESTTISTPDKKAILEHYGYSTNSPEQIIEATKSENYVVRLTALETLTQRTGGEAIPILKESLSDPEFEVRWRAAHFLGTLDDKGGLERMRQDLKKFAPNNGAPVPSDPNVVDPNEIKEQEGKRNLRLYNALRAAKVLAELGDRRGFELAAGMALEGPWVLHRYEAIFTLIEIAKADESVLQAEWLCPVFFLCAVAETEKNEHVIYLLTNQVQKNLDDGSAIQILEIAKDSSNISEKARSVVRSHFDKVKARIKGRSENKPKD
jgi:HEAT repeat protein